MNFVAASVDAFHSGGHFDERVAGNGSRQDMLKSEDDPQPV